MRDYTISTELKELPITFTGRGEVKGFQFEQIYFDGSWYVYKVTTYNESVHYEVFKRKINKKYNIISYPNSKAFGNWAWCSLNLATARKRIPSNLDSASAICDTLEKDIKIYGL